MVIFHCYVSSPEGEIKMKHGLFTPSAAKQQKKPNLNKPIWVSNALARPNPSQLCWKFLCGILCQNLLSQWRSVANRLKFLGFTMMDLSKIFLAILDWRFLRGQAARIGKNRDPNDPDLGQTSWCLGGCNHTTSTTKNGWSIFSRCFCPWFQDLFIR